MQSLDDKRIDDRRNMAFYGQPVHPGISVVGQLGPLNSFNTPLCCNQDAECNVCTSAVFCPCCIVGANAKMLATNVEVVGLYKLNAVDHSLKAPGFNPLNLEPAYE